MNLAEIGHTENAQGVAAKNLGELSRRGSDPTFEIAGDHPRAAADVSFGYRTVAGGANCLEDMNVANVAPGHVVEPTVVALSNHWNDDVVLVADPRILFDHVANHGIGNRPHRHRVG